MQSKNCWTELQLFLSFLYYRIFVLVAFSKILERHLETCFIDNCVDASTISINWFIHQKTVSLSSETDLVFLCIGTMPWLILRYCKQAFLVCVALQTSILRPRLRVYRCVSMAMENVLKLSDGSVNLLSHVFFKEPCEQYIYIFVYHMKNSERAKTKHGFCAFNAFYNNMS